MKLQPDMLEVKHWIFPLNNPKRDYQYNISKHCLFDNTLVALPTGLGKTFIAGVVMLNFYRWFPTGKVVFVAPTKPLVAQQIDACHKTCGIPGRDAAELTGEVSRVARARAWGEKRVFYMTPQTLENDLASDNCDARDIILLVIDEAHKGTGDYAYAKVVRCLMAKNPHFRVLALTATPGGNPDAVQRIVDALHISRIEIRDERSIDIRGYNNEKKVEQHIIQMNEGVVKIRDLLGKAMKPHINRLQSVGLVRGDPDPVSFHTFRAQLGMGEVNQRPDKTQLQWAFPALKKLSQMARAMAYLLEASVQMCHRSLKDVTSTEQPGGGANALGRDPAVQAVLQELERQSIVGFAIHPKMEKLKMLIIQHFGQKMPDTDVQVVESIGEAENAAVSTRAMVFVTNREAIDEVVEFLNQESPLIRSSKFIGQGTDKQGKKGMLQREQLDIIRRFKEGEFNVLVSTSIGEEGLDIGEVDMVVCYDAQKTPIRMLQRVGRTGRKRQGYVHVLLAAGREELNWNKAQSSYSEVQQSIVRGEQLEFYADVERLLPDSVRPECIEMVMDIEEYDREAKVRRRASSPQEGPKSKKRKRTIDSADRSIPPGAATGFVSVADLVAKGAGAKKKQKKTKEIVFDEAAGLDDDTDEEIVAGLFAPRRAVSTSPATSKKSKSTKPKPRRAISSDGSKKPAARKKKKSPKRVPPTLSQIEERGIEDSDDEAIERGIVFSRSPSPIAQPRLPVPSISRSSPPSSPELPLAKLSPVIDISSTSSESRSPSPIGVLPPSSPDRPIAQARTTTSRSSSKRSISIARSTTSRSPMPSYTAAPAQSHKEDLSWLLADSDDASVDGTPEPNPQRRAASSDSEVEIVQDLVKSPPPIEISSSPPKVAGRSSRSFEMPPPALPVRFTRPILEVSSPELVPPEPTFAVRAVGKGKKRVAIRADSSPLDLHSPAPKRLQRNRPPSPSIEESPIATKVKRRKVMVQDAATMARINPWVHVEASHSGDEVSGGSGDEDTTDFENDSDRLFLEAPPETQVSPSYNQDAAYRQSLMSQAPAGMRGPAFTRAPVRRGAVFRSGGGRRLNAGPRTLSSSPRRQNEEPDEYHFGSFVVEDEADISIYPSSDL
ncbi:hypothetical protein OF83DRAFT_1051753 [Amylostereum chailletii]|nr:hypothetical protein OF83DRAFT_1051753 [Amylostereum chailletii]